MASSFPNSIDNFTDPLATSPLNSPSHSAQHADLNDAVEKIETYMGLMFVTGADFTGTGAVNVSGCFTSIYSHYRVIIAIDTVTSDAARTINMRFRTAAGDDSASIYIYASQMSGLGNSAFNRNNSGYGQTETKLYDHHYMSNTSGATIDILNPFNVAKKTSYLGIVRGGYATEDTTGTFTGQLNTAKSHTGFSFYPTTGGITGSYAIYGYRK